MARDDGRRARRCYGHDQHRKRCARPDGHQGACSHTAQADQNAHQAHAARLDAEPYQAPARPPACPACSDDRPCQAIGVQDQQCRYCGAQVDQAPAGDGDGIPRDPDTWDALPAGLTPAQAAGFTGQPTDPRAHYGQAQDHIRDAISQVRRARQAGMHGDDSPRDLQQRILMVTIEQLITAYGLPAFLEALADALTVKATEQDGDHRATGPLAALACQVEDMRAKAQAHEWLDQDRRDQGKS